MKICPRLSGEQVSELEKIKKETESVSEFKKASAILLLDQKEPIGKITAVTGLKRSRIFGIRKNYFKFGIKVVIAQKRRVFELLRKKQIKEIEDILLRKTLQDFEYNAPFWSTSILADLIFRKFKVKYKSKTSYYLIFKKVRFTYHKPGRVYEKRDEEEMAKWRIKVKPIIKKYLAGVLTR